MKRFWRGKTEERRPLLNCCSVSISISCCSLPAAIGLALTATLIWLGIRFGLEGRREHSEQDPAS